MTPYLLAALEQEQDQVIELYSLVLPVLVLQFLD